MHERPVLDEARIEALEVKLAHLERAVQELSEVLYRQQRELDALRGRFQQLLDRALAAGPGTDAAPKVEIPPHY
jgi:SlyX protein